MLVLRDLPVPLVLCLSPRGSLQGQQAGVGCDADTGPWAPPEVCSVVPRGWCFPCAPVFPDTPSRWNELPPNPRLPPPQLTGGSREARRRPRSRRRRTRTEKRIRKSKTRAERRTMMKRRKGWRKKNRMRRRRWTTE